MSETYPRRAFVITVHGNNGLSKSPPSTRRFGRNRGFSRRAAGVKPARRAKIYLLAGQMDGFAIREQGQEAALIREICGGT